MIVDQNDACHDFVSLRSIRSTGTAEASALGCNQYIYASCTKRASFFRDAMTQEPAEPQQRPASRRRKYRRLRTLQRAGLLAPLLKLQRKIEGR